MIIRRPSKPRNCDSSASLSVHKSYQHNYDTETKQLFSCLKPKHLIFPQVAHPRNLHNDKGNKKSRRKMEAPIRKDANLCESLAVVTATEVSVKEKVDTLAKAYCSDLVCVSPKISGRRPLKKRPKKSDVHSEPDESESSEEEQVEFEKCPKIIMTKPKGNSKLQEVKVCPICGCYTPANIIEHHANMCLRKLEKGLNLYTDEPIQALTTNRSSKARRTRRRTTRFDPSDNVIEQSPNLFEQIGEESPQRSSSLTSKNRRSTRNRRVRKELNKMSDDEKIESDAAESVKLGSTSTKGHSSN